MEDSDLITYPVHGGPDGGKITQVQPGTTGYSTYRDNLLAPFVGPDKPAPTMPVYKYVLAPDPRGSMAFLPEADHDLLAAYQRTTGEPSDPGADALLAEIERRGLDV